MRGRSITKESHAIVDTIPNTVRRKSWTYAFDNDTNPCEYDLQYGDWTPFFPPKQEGTEYKSCPNDTSLCCFAPPDAIYGTVWELVGFKILQVPPYMYRLHYEFDYSVSEVRNQLTTVFRICVSQAPCEDGQTPPEIDYPPYNSTRRTTTKTWNRPVTTLVGGNAASISPTIHEQKPVESRATADEHNGWWRALLSALAQLFADWAQQFGMAGEHAKTKTEKTSDAKRIQNAQN